MSETIAMHHPIRDWISEGISTLFIFLFGYTGLSKILTFSAFQAAISQSELLAPVSNIVAWFIPGLELLIAFLLIIPATRRVGLSITFPLMLSFTLYVGTMLLQYGHKLPCTCGGILNKLSWPAHLWINVALSLLAIAALKFYPRPKILLQ